MNLTKLQPKDDYASKPASEIQRRYVTEAYYVGIDKAYYEANSEKIKKSKGFVGRASEDEIDVHGTKVIALLFATKEEREEFKESVTSPMNLFKAKLFYNADSEENGNSVALSKPFPVYSDWYRNDEWRAWSKTPRDNKLDIVKATSDEMKNMCDAMRIEIEEGRADSRKILDELPLPEFAMAMGVYGKESDVTIEFRKTEGGLTVIGYDFEDKRYVQLAIFDPEDPTKSKDIGYEIRYAEPTFKNLNNADSLASTCYATFVSINWFIKNLPSSYSVSKSKVKDLRKQSRKAKKRNKGHVVYFRTEYQFDLKGRTAKQIAKEIKCLCWGVRGHVRHYKGGKTIFIQPYRKGKMRDNPEYYETKTYKTEAKNEEIRIENAAGIPSENTKR